MKIQHWMEEQIVSVQLVDGPDDYGREIAEGVIAHYRKDENEPEDVLVRIEITSFAAQGRDTSQVSFRRTQTVWVE